MRLRVRFGSVLENRHIKSQIEATLLWMKSCLGIEHTNEGTIRSPEISPSLIS